jgi:hypothetical protein
VLSVLSICNTKHGLCAHFFFAPYLTHFAWERIQKDAAGFHKEIILLDSSRIQT